MSINLKKSKMTMNMQLLMDSKVFFNKGERLLVSMPDYFERWYPALRIRQQSANDSMRVKNAA